jgi:hypothetical protein
MNPIVKAYLVTLLVVLIAACSAHPKRIDCEKRLQPINLPAPPKGSGVQP